MRAAVISTLKALYENKKVTANNCMECNTTRITNEISIIRNNLDIEIATDRIATKNNKWYGSYRLVRTKENLLKAQKILNIGINSNAISSRK